MNRVLIDKVLPLFNKVYHRFPSLYLPLYFGYKRLAEAETVNFVGSWLKAGDVVFDVGANVGFYTRLFSRLVGNSGEVHAFEPDRTNFEMLEKVCGGQRNTFLKRTAISDKNKILHLYHSEKRNTDHQTFNIGEKRSTEKVKAIGLDRLFRNKKVNLIKIDIQGYDYYALLGMRKIVKSSRRLALIGEVWPYGLNKAGVSPEEYLRLIKELGLKIKKGKIGPLKARNEVENPYYFVNFIAVKT